MMMSAQQNTVGNVGVSVVSGPLVDVVSFGPACRPVTVVPKATAIARGERDLLPGGEEPGLPSKIEDVSVVAERDRDRAARTDQALDRAD